MIVPLRNDVATPIRATLILVSSPHRVPLIKLVGILVVEKQELYNMRMYRVRLEISTEKFLKLFCTKLDNAVDGQRCGSISG